MKKFPLLKRCVADWAVNWLLSNFRRAYRCTQREREKDPEGDLNAEFRRKKVHKRKMVRVWNYTYDNYLPTKQEKRKEREVQQGDTLRVSSWESLGISFSPFFDSSAIPSPIHANPLSPQLGQLLVHSIDPY